MELSEWNNTSGVCERNRVTFCDVCLVDTDKYGTLCVDCKIRNDEGMISE